MASNRPSLTATANNTTAAPWTGYGCWHGGFTGDAVTEITRLKAEDGGPMDIAGATLAAAAMREGLIDEYAVVLLTRYETRR